jgi:thiol-disulfide isomerase/thioredoxin
MTCRTTCNLALAVLAAAALCGCCSHGACGRRPVQASSDVMSYCGPSGCDDGCAEDASWSALTRVETRREFDRRVLAADRPVLVAFYTHHCEYCEALAPKVLRLAEDYGEDVGFFCVCKVDSEDVVEPHHLRGYPTIILFRDGREARRWLGDLPEADYRDELDALTAAVAGAALNP